MGPKWWTSRLPLDLQPQCTLILTHQAGKTTSTGTMTDPRPTKDQKEGYGPTLRNLCHFPKAAGIISHLLAHEITQLIKANHTIFWHSFCLRWPTLSVECISLQIHFLPFTFSHWILCDETPRPWPSLSPKNRCVISVATLWVLAGFKSQSELQVSVLLE